MLSPSRKERDVAREAMVEHEEDMVLTAQARRIGSLKNEIDVNGRHTIVTDEPEGLGGMDEARALRVARRSACGMRRDNDRALCGAPQLAPGSGDGRCRLQPEDSPCVETAIELNGRPLPGAGGPSAAGRPTCPLRRALESEFSFEEQLTVTAARSRYRLESGRREYRTLPSG